MSRQVTVTINSVTYNITVAEDNTWKLVLPTELPDGIYNAIAQIIDSDGVSHNAEDDKIVVDTTDPEVIITEITNARQPVITGEFIDDNIYLIEVEIVGVEVYTVELPESGSIWVLSITEDIPNGDYVAIVSALDKSDNAYTAPSFPFTIDVEDPIIDITSLVNSSNIITASGTWLAIDEDRDIVIEIDGEDIKEEYLLPVALGSGIWNFSTASDVFPDGDYKFIISTTSTSIRGSSFMCEADSGSSLNNKYIFFSSTLINYFAWFNVDGAGSEPTVIGRTAIEVTISEDASNIDVASVLSDAVIAVGVFKCLLDGESLLILNLEAGLLFGIPTSGNILTWSIPSIVKKDGDPIFSYELITIDNVLPSVTITPTGVVEYSKPTIRGTVSNNVILLIININEIDYELELDSVTEWEFTLTVALSLGESIITVKAYDAQDNEVEVIDTVTLIESILNIFIDDLSYVNTATPTISGHITTVGEEEPEPEIEPEPEPGIEDPRPVEAIDPDGKWLVLEPDIPDELTDFVTALDKVNSTISEILGVASNFVSIIKVALSQDFTAILGEVIAQVETLVTTFMNQYVSLGAKLLVLQPTMGGLDQVVQVVSNAFGSMKGAPNSTDYVGGLCLISKSRNAYKMFKLMELFKELFGIDIVSGVQDQLTLKVVAQVQGAAVFWLLNDLLFLSNNKDSYRIDIYRKDRDTGVDTKLAESPVAKAYIDTTYSNSVNYAYRVDLVNVKAGVVETSSQEYFVDATESIQEDFEEWEVPSMSVQPFKVNNWWGFSVDQIPWIDKINTKLTDLVGRLVASVAPATDSLSKIQESILAQIEYYENLINYIVDIVTKMTALLEISLDLNINLLLIPPSEDEKGIEYFINYLQNSGLRSGSRDYVAGGLLMFHAPSLDALGPSINFFTQLFKGETWEDMAAEMAAEMGEEIGQL